MYPQIPVLLDRLSNPEYLYLLLEPLALYGLLFGLLFFIACVALKQPKAQSIALLFIILSSLSVIPYRTEKADAMKRLMVIRDAGYTRMMKRHGEMRDQAVWVHYSMAGLALVGLLGRSKLPSLLNPLIILGGLAALCFYLWLNLKEAEIYHPNLRRTTFHSPTPASPGSVV